MTSGNWFSVPDLPEAIPALCPVSGLPIRSQPEWSYTHPDGTYRTTIALIGDALFWVIPRGYITEASMSAATSLASEILAQVHVKGKPFVFIENFAHAQGGTVGARRRYLRFTNTLEGLLGSFPYGMSPFFRLSFNFSRRLHLHRYRVQMMACYEDAVAAALGMLQRHGVSPGPSPGRGAGTGRGQTALMGPPAAAKAAAAETPHALAAHVDALLAYLGALDLESPGVPHPPETAGAQQTLGPVYEALAMLKMDMDYFLSEHHALIADLQDRQRQRMAQTDAIEGRNRELQALLQQCAGDQAALGFQVRQNIDMLLIPVLRLIAGDLNQPTASESMEQLETGIGAFVQNLFPPQDLRHYRLTPREMRVARLIREGEHSRRIARRLGISVATVAAFRRRLRDKLDLRGRKRNLRTVLQALPDADNGRRDAG